MNRGLRPGTIGEYIKDVLLKLKAMLMGEAIIEVISQKHSDLKGTKVVLTGGLGAAYMADQLRSAIEVRGIPGYLVLDPFPDEAQQQDRTLYFETENGILEALDSRLLSFLRDDVRKLLDRRASVFCSYENDENTGDLLIHFPELHRKLR